MNPAKLSIVLAALLLLLSCGNPAGGGRADTSSSERSDTIGGRYGGSAPIDRLQLAAAGTNSERSDAPLPEGGTEGRDTLNRRHARDAGSEATNSGDGMGAAPPSDRLQLAAAGNFRVMPIPDDIFALMQGKSYKADCTIPRESLRYILCLHKDIDGNTHVGEMIASETIADDLLEIFRELYLASYPIEKMRLPDYYDADDERIMSDNCSSCFNFRPVSGSGKLSKHAMGLAVDINPLYNPFRHTVNGQIVVEPATAGPYADREADFPYKIEPDDLCVRLFKAHGFTWGGDWKHSKDWQHFQK